jgi:hypothetical protein
VPKYNVPLKIDLSGPDGNAFVILGRVRSILRQIGASDEEIAAYRAQATSGDYDNLLAVTAEWVDFQPEDDDWEDEDDE